MAAIPRRTPDPAEAQAMPTFDCPTCRKPVTVADKADLPFRPFCSKRCKMVDLGRWLDGTYAIHEPAAPAATTIPEDLDPPVG